MVLLLIDKLIELAFKMNKPIEDYTKIGCIVRFKGEGGFTFRNLCNHNRRVVAETKSNRKESISDLWTVNFQFTLNNRISAFMRICILLKVIKLINLY